PAAARSERKQSRDRARARAGWIARSPAKARPSAPAWLRSAIVSCRRRSQGTHEPNRSDEADAMRQGRKVEVTEIEEVAREVGTDLGEGTDALPFQENLQTTEAVPKRRQLSVHRHVAVRPVVARLVKVRAILIVHSLAQH